LISIFVDESHSGETGQLVTSQQSDDSVPSLITIPVAEKEFNIEAFGTRRSYYRLWVYDSLGESECRRDRKKGNKGQGENLEPELHGALLAGLRPERRFKRVKARASN
jgi:hypothetical protein